MTFNDIDNIKVIRRVEKIYRLQENIRNNLIFILYRIVKYYNSKHMDGLLLKRMVKVYLRYRNIRTKRSSKKLNSKKLRAFKIVNKLFNISYKVSLLLGMWIYLVLHISLPELAPVYTKLNRNVEFKNITIENTKWNGFWLNDEVNPTV